ncbi:MAG: stage 0 sporulation family protein [Barnesiella sp.]
MDNTNDNNNNNEKQPDPCCCRRKGAKLQCYDWLADLPEAQDDTEMVEVQFKNTRKGYYKNSTHIKLEKGDLVAVEATPGHDIGEVTLIGRLVLLQMKKNGVKTDSPDLKRIYRKAKPNDLEKFEEAKAKEHSTMLKARKIAEDLKLNMKIGDVEYQGDGNKAIFYYIADDRVDFRQLIKVLADAFRVRIEMKQIGARQEAGRIGGIGPCGRQLCCSAWMTSFVSVATSAARFQDISLNPQKLAGQCAKLKCCLNYEVDAYVESQKKLPSREIVLETKMGSYYHFKTDIFKRQLTYSTSKDVIANLVTIDADRVFEIIALNKRGIKPDELVREGSQEPVRKEFEDVVGQDSLTRFDKTRKKNNRKGKGNGNGVNNQGGNKRQDAETQDERRSQNRQENREPGNNNRPKKRNNGLNRNGNNSGGNNNNNVRNNNSVNNNNKSKDKENEKPAE